jgi:hypothetical protein
MSTARTGLAGERRRHGDDSLPGARCLERDDAQEPGPSGIAHAFREVVILEHIGRLRVLVGSDIVRAHQGERRSLLEVPALAA